MSAFTACGVAGAWGWHRINSVPGHIRSGGDLWEILTYEPKPIFEAPSAAEIARTRARAELMKAELIHTHPLLAIDHRMIPAEQNAFLRLHRLTGDGQAPHKNVSRELSTAMEEKNGSGWDAAEMRSMLDGHRPLIRELREIGELRERSVNGMPGDYTGFVSAREIRNLAMVMLHSAKLAAVEGNAGQALRDVQCVRAIATHYQEVESPTLLMTTVTILLDGMVRGWVMDEMVTVLGPEADLRPWRELLAVRSYDPKLLSHTLRGEWHYLTGSFLLPVLLRDGPNTPPDVDDLMIFLADRFSESVERVAKASLADLIDLPGMDASEYSHLSTESRELARLLTVGWSKWGNGFVREAVRQRMALAAMEILILERSGSGEVGPDVMARLPRNPLDGTPFLYDPETRTVSRFAGDGDRPLILPE
ncbi:hypothetical protein OVA24_13280 [Luteolibacter sp. SL250]|uniref:hypothetical protein n=1 Tax=Luteolibacter sp. SL250 TaxID=2995170 RepID=UPI00226F31C6|nr:hypothetical protein [Luteolibacter sp. SL250]WAC18210.1 hypothetical protein OVA24_13280 [Luteolibacter sp. SL250]